MATLDISEVPASPAPIQEATGPAPDADRTRVRQLAQQFESMLLTQMLREMRDAMAPEKEDEGLGGSIMGDTVNSELGLSLGKAGGVGLADALMKALTRLDESDRASASSDTTMAVNPDTVDIASGLARTTSKAVSSDFGWRHDPINGQQRFHAGMDFRLAYGQEVRAASAGVVKFAGDQSGYGLTVVLDHGDGIETRYAHLSTADVRVGATVGAGQPIARSGNSGRTTGPHLHFEVRQNGQPVDPETVSGLVQIADIDDRIGH